MPCRQKKSTLRYFPVPDALLDSGVKGDHLQAISRMSAVRFRENRPSPRQPPCRRICRVTTCASTVSLAAETGAGVYFLRMYHIWTMESTWLRVQ